MIPASGGGVEPMIRPASGGRGNPTNGGDGVLITGGGAHTVVGDSGLMGGAACPCPRTVADMTPIPAAAVTHSAATTPITARWLTVGTVIQ